MMLGLDYIIAPQVPRGLGPVVEGLAREILRERPRDIYTFAAHHFEKLVKLRDRESILDKPLNGRDRPSIWTGLNNNDIGDYTNCSSNFGSGKHNVFVQDMTLIKEQSVTTPIMRKVPKKKRQATGRSGWSINETVKVFKKYKYVNDIEDKRLHDMEVNEQAFGKGNAGNSEQCSPRHLEKIIHGRLVRSSSAGNVYAKNTECLRNENKEEFGSFVPYTKRSLTIPENKCVKHCKIVNILNRQRSADQVASIPARFRETEEQPYITFGRRRSRSLVNEKGSSRNEKLTGIKVEERTDCSEDDRGFRNCHSSALQGTIAKVLQNEKKELEQMLYSSKEVDTKLNIRSWRKGEQDLKNNEFIFDDIDGNKPTFVQHVTSVVLPSVVTRRKCTKNNECRINDQRDSSDNLILPPIPSDTLTSNERNDHLALPPSLVAEDVRLNSPPTYCYNRAYSNLDRCDGEESISLTETNRLESANSDSEDSWRECHENEIVIFANSPVERCSTGTKENVDIVRDSIPPEKGVGESFKDSLNVTPDLIDVPQRPDSLEYFENSSSTPMTVDNQRENCGQGPRGEEAHYRSNELKRKLIEIEMVERNIESTLISSQSISACENGFEGSCLIPFPTVDDLKSDRSNCTRRNETVLICDADIRRSNDTNETNLSCCDLTAYASSQTSKILTTLIISDKHCQQVHDVPLERGCEEMINKGRHSDESPSSRNRDTLEEFREGCQNYVDPFGEYINPEILDNSTAIVGVRFQHDIRNVVGRSAVYQDLENINEEEEDENAKLSNNMSRYNDIDSSRLDEATESAERKKSIERKAELLKFSNHGKADDPIEHTSFYNPRNVTQTRSDEYVEKKEETEHIVGGMSTNPKAKESMIYNNRSCTRSLSSDDIAPYIPELNLDSLQDLTISSLEENDSKYLERNIEVENYDITSCDDENISSSSGNNLISEKNMTTFSSENESSREQFFSNRKILAIGLDCESDVSKCFKIVYQECKPIDIPAADENAETSLSMEENVVDVPLDDFIEDTLMLRELTRQNNNQPPLEQIGNDGHTYQKKKQEIKRGDQVEEGGRMRSLSSSNKQWNELLVHQRKFQEIDEFLTSERIIITGQKDDTISSLRHTGEFHDSFPLSLAELTTSVPTSNVYSLKAICGTANHSPTVQPNFIKNQVFTTVCGMSVTNYKFLQTTASYATDISNSFRLFDNKLSWIQSWLNDPSNVIYVGPIFNETFTDRTIVSLAHTILDPDRDDCREPLALDNTLKPIVIEEISNVQDEREKWACVTSCKADIYFPAAVGECLSKANQNANSNEAGKKELFHGLLSTYEVERFINDNDSLRNVTRYSSILQQNSNPTRKSGNAEEYQADESTK